MAVIKKGEHVQDIRGSVKNHVYSDWRGKGYLRSKAINPSNPRSSRQADTRSTMVSFSRAWKTILTDTERALWNEYAQTQARRKPDPKRHALIIPAYRVTMSGFNTFVSINRLLYEAGLIVPPAIQSVPPLSSDITPSSPLNLTAAWNYGWHTYLSEDFEDEAVGSTPNQWTPPWVWNPGIPANAIRVTNVLSHSGTKCALIAFPSVPGGSALYAEAAFIQDGVEFDFYVRTTHATINRIITYIWNAIFTGYSANLRFGATGKWRYRDGLVWKEWGTYLVNTWYHIKFVLFNSTQLWDLYVDDMVTPAVAGISFAVPSIPAVIWLFADIGAGSIYIDDFSLRAPVTPGLDLSWTDPSNAPAGSIIRTWTQAHNVGVHKQQVAMSALGAEAYTLTHARVANGETIPLTNLPGNYKLQLDCISPAGKQSAPSNLIEVTVPSV